MEGNGNKAASMNGQTKASQGNEDDAAWEALLSDPEVVEETEKIASEIRQEAANGGLGSEAGKSGSPDKF